MRELYTQILKSAYKYAAYGVVSEYDESDALATAIFAELSREIENPLEMLEDRGNRLKKIFRTCLNLLIMYADGVPDSAWTSAEIYWYWKGKIEKENEVGSLASNIFAACVEELKRQWMEGK